jgi:DNA-binding NarL/FixJ family response regulator
VSQLAAEPAELVLVDTAVARPDSAGFTRRALAAAPNATVVLFGTEKPRTAAAAIAAGARGVIGAERTDPVTLVTKAVLLLLSRSRLASRDGSREQDEALLDGTAPGAWPPDPEPAAGPVGATASPLHTAVAVPHQRGDAASGPPRRRVELTEREMQVLRGMADGKSNAEIGRELYLSEDTVKTHARRLFRKLRARDRAHAVASAFRAGLVS